MGKIKKIAIVVIVVIASLGVSNLIKAWVDSKATPPPVPQSSSSLNTEVVTPDQLLVAINEERSKAGVPPLQLDPRLNSSAQRKVDEIVNEGRQPNPHLNAAGVHGYTYAKEAMPECKRVSETLVSGFQNEDDKVADGVKTWLGSPTHRDAILNPNWTYTGFGIGQNDFAEHFCQV